MKKTVLIILSLICFIFSNAQFKVIGESQPFEEPKFGYAKLVQLKNGNTFFLRFTEKDGIYVRPYDAKHKEGAEVHIEPLYKKLTETAIQSVFEVGGDIVVFARNYGKGPYMLYRMIIDGESGKLKEDKVLFTIEKLSGKDNKTLYDGASLPGYIVTKDRHSENYAIVLLNSFTADKNQRLEVYHYGANHNVINHGYCKLEDDYKFVNLAGLEVIGKEAVCVMVRGFNKELDGTAGSETSLVTLTSNTAKAVKLDVCKNATSVKGILKYNPVTKKIVTVVSVQGSQKDKGYTPYVCYMDPTLNKVEGLAVINPTAASAKSADLFKDKKGFTGLPQNICINHNGSFAIVNEEIPYEDRLGNVIVSMFTGIGTEIGSYLIPMSHFLSGQYGQGFCLDGGDLAPQHIDLGNHFRSSVYIMSPTETYILFNDLKGNEERVSQGKRPEVVSTVADCDAYVYSIEGKDIMPARKYLFSEPAKSVHNLAAFTISDYDRESNTLVTLKLNMDEKHKTVNLVWLQPS